MKNENTIEALNSLITINNDRIEGYETASKETEETELKSLFARFISTSQKCKLELIREVNMLGGKEAVGTKISGKFFRVWMDLKAALTGKDREVILDSCEFGEDQAKETYDKVITNNFNHLSMEHQTMINLQAQSLQTDRNHLKSLGDASADV